MARAHQRSTDAGAECFTCGKTWGAANAVGVAAQHAERYGHHVIAEQSTTMSWNSPT